MTARLHRDRLRRLGVLAAATLLLLSAVVLTPGFLRNAAAMAPTFSRPNIKVDAGIGPVDAQLGRGPAIAVGLGGVLHAVWSDGRSGSDKGIYYAKSLNNGGTWIAEKRIDGTAGLANVAPSIAVDTGGGPYSGSIYVVWQKGDGPSADILFIKSIDDGLTWVNRYRIDTAPMNVPSTLPRVAVDGAGTIYVTFTDGRNGDEDVFVATSETGGFGWSADEPLSSSPDFDEHPAISASGTTAAVIWEANGAAVSRLVMAVSSNKGASWNLNTVESKVIGSGNVSWPSALADHSGVLHASWTFHAPAGAYSIAYSKSNDDGVTWTFPVRVDDNTASPSAMTLSSTIVSTATALYIVWSDNRNGDYDVYVSWSDNGGVTWGDFIPDSDVRVDDTDDNAPTADDSTAQLVPFATASQFGVYSVWADLRDNVALHTYFSSFDGSPLIVTEMRDSPDGMERIEVFNRGSVALDVTGWFVDIDGSSDFISALGSIPPSQYRTIGDEASSDLQADITLNDEGGSVRIFDNTGNLREIVSYGQKGIAPDPVQFESVSRVYDGGAYTRHWTRTPISTFGAQNTGLIPDTDSELLLNEVFYDSSVLAKRFIEVIYTGNGTLDLTGYNVVSDAAYSIPAASLNSTSNYLLIYPMQAPLLFTPIDIPGDNLYLYDSSGVLLDMVGWDSTHVVDTSVCRVPDGSGFSEGFDDRSSIASGWAFSCLPSPHLIGIGPPGTTFANLGDIVYHDVHVTNFMNTPTKVDLKWNFPPSGWAVTLTASDHMTLLTDTNSNGWPDVSLDSFGTAGQTVDIAVRVTAPSSVPLNDSIVTTVVAEAQPEGRDSVSLTTGFYPYLSLNRSANPATVYVRGTGYGEESAITLQLQGRGIKIPGRGPDALDVVFVIDDTGSMSTWIDAVKADVDRITSSLLANITDIRFGLVSYGDVPNIDIDIDLTSDTTQFKTALFALTASGGGDLPEDSDIALETAANLSWRLGVIPKVMILMGDAPAHDNAHLAEVARWAYNVLNIHTNAIGCGSDINMINAFTTAALEGHGYFVQLGNPSTMADVIITGIMAVLPTIDYAAQDRDLTDGNPMVRDVLPPYIAYSPGTFTDPVTKAPRPPAYTSVDGSGNTVLEWNVSVLKINKTWSVQFNITSSMTGLVLTNVLGLSRVSYTNWSGANVTADFPPVWITVLPAPPLSDLTLSPSDIVPFPPSPFLEMHSMFLNATIHNIGQNTSSQTVVRFHDGMPPAPTIGGDQTLPPIPMLGTGVMSVPWTPAVAGTHLICVVIDPNDLVREENETNNMACLTVYVDPTMPDYVPILQQPPTDFTIGLSLAVNLSVFVMNQGNRSASSSSTLAFRNQTGLPFQLFALPAIPEKGSSAVLTARWTSPVVTGTYIVLVAADYYDAVTEWDEANNMLAWTVHVVNGPITKLEIGNPNITLAKRYVRSTTPLQFNVEDRSGVGIIRTLYSIDYGQWLELAPGGSFYLSGDGEHNVRWYSEDLAGNTESANSASLVVDDTPPVSSLAVGNPKYVGGGTWVTSLTPMSLSAVESGAMPVGLGPTHFRIRHGSWGNWQVYSSPFMLTGGDGPRDLELYTEDLLGNSETVQSLTMIVDNTPPAMTLEPVGSRFAIGTAFSVTADDGGGSGVSLVWVSKDGGSFDYYTAPFSLDLGRHTIVYKSVDMLGNPTESSRVVDVVDVGTDNVSVSHNYKPVVAFVFALLLFLVGAFSAKRRPMKYGKSPGRRFALSLAVLPLPFLIMEAATGLLSVSYEFLRIPPLLGWGTMIDTLVLAIGVLFLVLRLALRRKVAKGREAEKPDAVEGREDATPPPPED